MMIMVTTPVSVVTYAIIAGEVAIATPATPSILLVLCCAGLVLRLTTPVACRFA
jgi:hypothetical protein